MAKTAPEPLKSYRRRRYRVTPLWPRHVDVMGTSRRAAPTSCRGGWLLNRLRVSGEQKTHAVTKTL